MSEYQVLARKYRPKTFQEVVGQDAIVTTLLNAIQLGKTAHAYLFCGSRGTGKTSIARLFAKALNCQHPTGYEPCNKCSSCLEIAGGYSMDVLEIDGASHRGIEDVRQINDTIGYAPSSGKYKIYLIDEVHMLTKEAFNALLKTLEEPPAKVKFFFATTEPHKIPPTILSRCQRFNLKRISSEKIQQKLDSIAKDLGIKVQPAALHLIAQLSEGGLRDAESLLDQSLAYSAKELTVATVSEALGILPRDLLFSLDEAGRECNYGFAFSLGKEVFSSGVHLPYFMEQLLSHFRTILLLKIGSPVDLTEETMQRYRTSATFYTESQCLEILEIITTAQQEIKSAPSEQVALEMLLLRILRSHQKIPFEQLVQRLSDMEKKLTLAPIQTTELKQTSYPSKAQISPPPLPKEPPIVSLTSSISEDPTPRQEELPQKKITRTNLKENEEKSEPPPTLSKEQSLRERAKVETLMRFAAKELDGSLDMKER